MRRSVVGAHGALRPSHPRRVTGAAARCRGHDRRRGRRGSMATPLMSRRQRCSVLRVAPLFVGALGRGSGAARRRRRERAFGATAS